MAETDEPSASWPVHLRGVTESVVTTRGPKGRWNLAALGLRDHDPVTARTWGNTRTRKNFDREAEGYVAFTADPVDFVDAALAVRVLDDPILPSADAWVRVDVDRTRKGESGGTRWEEWELSPVESKVEREVVATINRGYNAVIEATVAASRLDVPAYDTDTLLERLRYLEGVVQRCGGQSDREAFDRLSTLSDWRERTE